MIKLKDGITVEKFDRDNLPEDVDHHIYTQDDASGIYTFDRYTIRHKEIKNGDWILRLGDDAMVLRHYDAENFFDLE